MIDVNIWNECVEKMQADITISNLNTKLDNTRESHVAEMAIANQIINNLKKPHYDMSKLLHDKASKKIYLKKENNTIKNFADGYVSDIKCIDLLINGQTKRFYQIDTDTLFGERKLVISEEEFLKPQKLLMLLRSKGGISFDTLLGDKRVGEMISASLMELLSNKGTIEIDLLLGWKDAESLFFDKGQPELDLIFEEIKVKKKRFIFDNVFNNNESFIRYIHSLDVFAEEKIKIILILWLHYSLMYSLFEKKGITIPKVLCLMGSNIDSILNHYLKIFNRDIDEIVSLSSDEKTIWDYIFSSKDDNVILCDCQAYTKYKNDQIKEKRLEIVEFFTKGKSNKEINNKLAKPHSALTLLLQPLNYCIDASQALYLEIDTIDNLEFNNNKLVDVVSSHLANFISFLEISAVEHLDIVLKNAALEDNPFADKSSYITYIVLIATCYFVELYATEFNESFVEKFGGLDMVKKIVKDFILETENVGEIDGIAYMIKDCLLDLKRKGIIKLLENSKALKRYIDCETKHNYILYDSHNIYIKLEQLKRLILPCLPIDITTNQILNALEMEGFLDMNKCQKKSYERKIMVYVLDEEPKRQSMICIRKQLFEEPGALPLL